MKIEKKLLIDKYYFLRKVDELGRYVIPIEIRNELKIKENDVVELAINEKLFTSKVDAIGRIVVPKDIRNELDIKVADELKVYIENRNIILKSKYII